MLVKNFILIYQPAHIAYTCIHLTVSSTNDFYSPYPVELFALRRIKQL